MTIEEFRSLSARKRKNKYGAVSTGPHASKKEHARAAELRLLQRAGQISSLREQVPFELIPSQRDPDGTLIERSCSYVADFVYVDPAGNIVVEDTKGFRTKEYIIKRKLMLHVHGIKIREL